MKSVQDGGVLQKMGWYPTIGWRGPQTTRGLQTTNDSNSNCTDFTSFHCLSLSTQRLFWGTNVIFGEPALLEIDPLLAVQMHQPFWRANTLPTLT